MPSLAPRSILASVLLSSLLLPSCKGDADKPAQAASPGPDQAQKDTSPPQNDTKQDDTKAETKAPAPDSTATSTRTWTFDDALPGQVPAGIRLAETHGQGTPATWAVVADDSAPTKPHAFGITESKNTKKTYNLALFEGTSYGDVDLQVMLRAVSGELNGGGGPIWRVEDENNYYIARWDPTEDNAYIYVVRSGNRTALATVDVQLDHEAWHALRVVAEGSRIQLFIDDEPVLTADDTSLTEPGMIGLWTKSDGATLFDDLSAGAP